MRKDTAVSGANRHGSLLVEPILASTHAIERGGRGHPPRRPLELQADEVFDDRRVQRSAAAAGSPPDPRIGRDSRQRLECHRRVVERNAGWLLPYGRVACAVAAPP